MSYVAKQGDTIYDIAFNVSGSLYAIDDLLTQNDLDSYTPNIVPGQEYVTNVPVYNNEVVRWATNWPYNSTMIPDEELAEGINEIMNALNGI